MEYNFTEFNEYDRIHDFNGELLQVGDSVIAIFGATLRKKIIENIDEYGSIKLSSIVRPFRSIDLIKISHNNRLTYKDFKK